MLGGQVKSESEKLARILITAFQEKACNKIIGYGKGYLYTCADCNYRSFSVR
jgi:hypothetical protein